MSSVLMPFQTQTSGIAVGDNDQFFRIRDIDPSVKMLNVDDGIFYKILSMLPSEAPATQPKYEWSEDDIPGNTAQVTTAYSSTSVVVDDSLPLIQNSIVQNLRTLELMYVTAVTYSTHTLTVSRGFAGTNQADGVVGDTLIFLGDQLPELANANTNNASIPAAFFNYIQRWSKGVSISDMQDVVAMIDGVGQLPREVARRMLQMKREINNALIRGHKSMAVSPVGATEGYVYTTDGFEAYIDSHILDLAGDNGVLSWPALNQWLNPIFSATSSSPTKMLICGEALFSAITMISWDRFEPAAFEETLGASVKRIVTDQGGIVDVVLDKYGFPTGTDASGDGILVDAAHVALKELTGQPLTWRPNVQDNDAHVRQDELWGTASLKLSHESTMGLVKGAVAQY